MSFQKEVVLQTRDLSKRFGKRWAVRNLNLEVHRGDIFCFLGPNGAGKSTAIRMILTLLMPTSGSIEIFGKDLHQNRRMFSPVPVALLKNLISIFTFPLIRISRSSAR